MGLIIDSVLFQGINGTIMRAKPVFEPIYPLGGSKVYMQRLRTESKQQNISVWAVFDTHQECVDHELSLRNILGLKKTAMYEGAENFTAFYVIDYTYTIKAKSNSKFLITYELTILADEETE